MKSETKTYSEIWPNHCPRCHGWGYFTWREETGEFMSDDCEHCLTQGTCPRCGTHKAIIITEEPDEVLHSPCKYCGFDVYADEGLTQEDELSNPER